MLVLLRNNETRPALAAGWGVSTTTAWRYVDETLEVLASWAPGLRESLVGLGEGDFVIVDARSAGADATVHTPYYHHGDKPSTTSSSTTTKPDSAPGKRAFAQLKTCLLLRRALFPPRHRNRDQSCPHPDDLHVFRMKTVD